MQDESEIYRRDFKSVNTLIMVKETLGAFGDVICAKKLVVQVFLLEQKHKMPTCLLLERDILHLLLQYLTGQMIKTSRSKGVAIIIGWKPPSGSEASSPKTADQTNPSTLEPVYVYQGTPVKVEPNLLLRSRDI